MSQKPANSLSRKALWGLLSLILLLQTACKNNQPVSEGTDQKNQNVQTGSSLQTRVSKKKTEEDVSPTRHEPVKLTKKLINNLEPRLNSVPSAYHKIVEYIFEDFRKVLLKICEDNSKIHTELVVRELSVLSAAIMCGLRPAFLQTLKELGADVNSKEGESFSPVFLASIYGSFETIKWLLDTKEVDLNDLKNDMGKPVPAIYLVFHLLQNPYLKDKQKKKVIERLVNAYEGELSAVHDGYSILEDIAISDTIEDADKLASIKMLFTIPELDIPDTELHHVLPLYLREKKRIDEDHPNNNGVVEDITKAFKKSIEEKEKSEMIRISIFGSSHGDIDLTVLGALVYADIDNMRYLEALFTCCPTLIHYLQGVGNEYLTIQKCAKKVRCSKKIKKKLKELSTRYDEMFE